MRSGYGLAALVLVAGCQSVAGSPPPTSGTQEAAEVRATLEAIPATLAEHGPVGWLEHFAPEFAMASDGALKFASLAEVREAMQTFGPTVTRMELRWSDLETELLAPGLARFGASYDELLVDRKGVETRFAGYVTGLAREFDGAWRIERMHWSLPVP